MLFAIVHVFVECSPTEALYSYGFAYVWDSIFGGPMGAPMFVFSMGIGLAFTKRNSGKDLIHRGLFMGVIWFIHNICRYLIPSAIGYAITNDAEQYLEELPYLLFGSDILSHAAIAMICMGILKSLKLNSQKILVIATAMNIFGMIFNDIDFGNNVLNVAMGHFIGTTSETVTIYSDYPILLWFIVYAFGEVYGDMLKRCIDKDRYYKIVTLPCLIIPICAIIAEMYYGVFMMGGEGDNVFYHMYLFDFAVCIMLNIGLMGIYHFALKHISEKVKSIIQRISKAITPIYFIQWIFVWWSTDLVLYVVRSSQELTSVPALVLGVALSVISVILGDLWTRRRTNKLKKTTA